MKTIKDRSLLMTVSKMGIEDFSEAAFLTFEDDEELYDVVSIGAARALLAGRDAVKRARESWLEQLALRKGNSGTGDSSSSDELPEWLCLKETDLFGAPAEWTQSDAYHDAETMIGDVDEASTTDHDNEKCRPFEFDSVKGLIPRGSDGDSAEEEVFTGFFPTFRREIDYIWPFIVDVGSHCIKALQVHDQPMPLGIEDGVTTGIESLTSGAGDDFLVGDSDDSILYGQEGNDLLIGGGGDDTLLGNVDATKLAGGDGNDSSIVQPRRANTDLMHGVKSDEDKLDDSLLIGFGNQYLVDYDVEERPQMDGELADGFWLHHAGYDKRHSDGSNGEYAILATVLHEIGWIDVHLYQGAAVVRLNPAVVSRDVLAFLKPALNKRAPDHRVELVLVDRDAAPVTIHYMGADAACAHLDEITRSRDDGVDYEIAPFWSHEAEPTHKPQALGEWMPNRIEASDDAAITLADDLFLRRLGTAEWLTPTGVAGGNAQRRLTRRQPAILSFAMRRLGYIAIKRSWRHHRRPFASAPAELIALDPAAVTDELREQLIRLLEHWRPMTSNIEMGWWNGSRWIREVGTVEELRDRIIFLSRATANDSARHALESRIVSLDQHAANDRWSVLHPFARALARWRAENIGSGSADALIRNLEADGIFEYRTKLVIADENSEMRIARYAPGSFQLWDDATHRALVGSRILDLPDRSLGRSVQSDLLDVYRSAEPTLHQCRGIIQAGGMAKMVKWYRLTLPIRRDHQSQAAIGTLLSICMLDKDEIA